MEKYSLLTGENLTLEKYFETLKLNNDTFKTEKHFSKVKERELFEESGRSTIVLWNNESNELVGFITPYFVKNSFFNRYIKAAFTNEIIDKTMFVQKIKESSGNIYIRNTIIAEKYRDKIIECKDTNSKFYGKTAFKILNEGLVDWICSILDKGISINYIFADRRSIQGEKYLKSLKLENCFKTIDDVKYARKFEIDCFKKCSNIGKLNEVYYKKSKKFDKDILKNHEYLKFEDDVLHFCDINLLDLVKKYKSPLEVVYTPIITKRINNIKEIFDKNIKKYNYNGDYYYAYATKANYYSEIVTTCMKECDMLETSSAYDINIIIKLFKYGVIKKDFTIICNGYKNIEYIKSIEYLLKKGINVIPIIENEMEYELLNRIITKCKYNVGLRYNSDFEKRLVTNDFQHNELLDNRFGFSESEVFKMSDKIKLNANMTLKVLHFHFGETINNIDNYIKGYANIFDLYCRLKIKNETLEYFDFGGGFPTQFSLKFDFNYEELIEKIIITSREIANKYKVQHPNLIGEHGRYTVSDSSFYIYKVEFTKRENNKLWYIINGSLMNMIPDIWGLKQEFIILPVNMLENECEEVYLGGETCDGDDRYFINDKSKKLYMPKIDSGELYIAIFCEGAYQKMLSGKGGVHHCLIPEGNQLVIYETKKGRKKYLKIDNFEKVDETLKKLRYDKINYIKNFWNL